MHPNQSPKAEVSDKPFAYFDPRTGSLRFSSLVEMSEAEKLGSEFPLYRRATDDRVRALVEAAEAAPIAMTNTQEIHDLRAALAGVKGEK